MAGFASSIKYNPYNGIESLISVPNVSSDLFNVKSTGNITTFLRTKLSSKFSLYYKHYGWVLILPKDRKSLSISAHISIVNGEKNCLFVVQ